MKFNNPTAKIYIKSAELTKIFLQVYFQFFIVIQFKLYYKGFIYFLLLSLDINKLTFHNNNKRNICILIFSHAK